MNHLTHCIKFILLAILFTDCSNSSSQEQHVLLHGYVYDMSEAPVSGAKIVLLETIYNTNLTGNNDGFSKNKNVLGTAITDPDGSFEINFEQNNLGGLNEISVTKDYYETTLTPVTISDQDAANSINVGFIHIDFNTDLPVSDKILLEEK